MNGRRRALLAVAGLVVMLAVAGCLSPVSDAELAENATYEFDREADASYRIYPGNYTAVLDIHNRSSIELFQRDGLGSKQALAISALQFRYENGTVVNDSAFDVSTSQSMVTVEPPTPNGTVAFTVPRTGSQFQTRVLVEGSHEVILPPGQKVTLPVLSRVVPGNYTTASIDDRVVVQWGAVERETITVKYYQDRDLFLFAGLAGVVLVIGAAGLVYFRRQVWKLRAQREELGLNVEEDEDDPRDRGPPPGMR